MQTFSSMNLCKSCPKLQRKFNLLSRFRFALNAFNVNSSYFFKFFPFTSIVLNWLKINFTFFRMLPLFKYFAQHGKNSKILISIWSKLRQQELIEPVWQKLSHPRNGLPGGQVTISEPIRI